MLLRWHNQKHLLALDIGTSKFCIASLREDLTQQPELDLISVKAEGMRRGMVADIPAAAAALNNLLEISERQLNCEISRVVVGVAGSHLDGYRATVSMPLNGEMVQTEHLVKLGEIVEGNHQRSEKEILHAVPLTYQIDHRERVFNPLGFSGHMLHGEYLLIFSDQNYMKDIVRLCNQCGLQVSNLYAEPFASASVTVPEDLKEMGCAVADIGGGTTDGIVFQNGRPTSVFTVNVAGFMATHDLSLGLNITPDEAEKVKIFFGLRPNDVTQSLEVKTIHGQPKLVVWRDVFQILGPRISELANLLVAELLEFKGALSGGMLLTGGGANLKGIEDFMNDQTKIPVSCATPSLHLTSALSDSTPTNFDATHPTKYATALGLLNLEISRLKESRSKQGQGWPARYLGQFVNWIKDLS